jgi:hypothetical protein
MWGSAELAIDQDLLTLEHFQGGSSPTAAFILQSADRSCHKAIKPFVGTSLIFLIT